MPQEFEPGKGNSGNQKIDCASAVKLDSQPDRLLEKNRLLWRCRQGTRELDTLLTNFVEKNFQKLSNQEIRDLNQLLDHSSPQLYAWLTGEEVPGNTSSAVLVEKIRKYKID